MATIGTDAVSTLELVEKLLAGGLDLGSDPEDLLHQVFADDTRFVELEGGDWVHVPSLLEGTTWSTRIDAEAALDGCVPVEPDLTLFGWWALASPIPFAGGALESVELDDGRDGIVGPPGWLEPYAGSTLLVEIADERVVLRAVESDPLPTPAQIEAVRVALGVAAESIAVGGGLFDEPITEVATAQLEDLLFEALVVDRAAFVADPVPPVDELLRGAGLERLGTTVGPVGTDWDVLRRWQLRQRLSARHDLTDDQTEALELVLGAMLGFEQNVAEPFGTPTEEPLAAPLFAACLADPDVAGAFFGEQSARGTDPEVLVAFTRRILTHVDDAGTAGARWVLARALDHLGDPLAAEAELERAVALGDDFPHADRALAAFASDRGDAARAFALVRDLDVDDDEEDPLFLEVEGYATARPRATVGRNELCPCGSGRKYKVCHLGRERLPLIDRAPWLYDKARRYLHDGRRHRLGAQLAMVVIDACGHYDLSDQILDSPLVDDVALCEAGVFADFVAERDALLPDDEALLAARWSLVPRALFEVQHAGDDHVALRDLRTGDHLVVTNTRSDRATPPGELLLGRPLPVDDTWRAYSGFVSVPDSMRDELLAALDDPDPFAIAELIGRCFAPPTLQNTDGEALVFHELHYRVDDPDATARALVAGGLHDDGDGSFTLVRDTANQADTLILTLELSGSELCVRANSDLRAAEARGLIARVVPDAVFEDDDVRELDEVLADPRHDRAASTAPLSPDDPAVAAALDEYMREHERRWVDEPVPALRGMTPREASVDPVGRVELERLLRGAEERPGGPGTFDVTRVRALLDMP